MGSPEPLLPDYGGACIDAVVPGLLGRADGAPVWLPSVAAEAGQIVLLVVDGLGWDQLRQRAQLAPFLTAMAGGAITSVVPTTTATALTSITTGLSPAAHEVLGYRVAVQGEVLNVLRWRMAGGDARQAVPPAQFQRHEVFGGTRPLVLTRSEFAASGFTASHLPGVRLAGWQVPSTLVELTRRALAAGETFVFAYYDGIDKVAHEYGFGPFYDAELEATDRLVGALAAALPAGAALVVTSDHGQVFVGDATMRVPSSLLAATTLLSGEGRFRWLHARPGAAPSLAAGATDAFGEVAWVRTVDDLERDGWFGGPLSAAGRARLGDVAVIPFTDVAIEDTADSGEVTLRCRHGSLTEAEMLVPLLAVGP